MTFSRETHVADIAAAVPSSVRVFQRFGIDFCCGGRKPVGEVCAEHKVPYEELAAAIEASAADRSPEERNWTAEPLTALADHIEARYHARLREELPRLEQMAWKVSAVHGGKGAQPLERVHAVVRELAAELQDHMIKEERILFPSIRGLELNRPGVPIAVPVAVMEQEHEHAGALLAELREITDGYVAPEWACQTYRSLFHGLDELERDMHIHVHLENNVLFPRAMGLAGSAATGGD